jgi:Tol biopolymer transport system component
MSTGQHMGSKRLEPHRVAMQSRPGGRTTPAANDIQPTVRKDGLEVVFSSNRAGGSGGQDIWSATRASVDAPWSAAVNLGSNVNTGFGESRPSLSRDARQLLFGRAGPAGTGEGGTGLSDVYVTTRDKSED